MPTMDPSVTMSTDPESSSDDELIEPRYVPPVLSVERQKTLPKEPTSPDPFELAISKLPKDLLKSFDATNVEAKEDDLTKHDPNPREHVASTRPLTSRSWSIGCLSGLRVFSRSKPKHKPRKAAKFAASGSFEDVTFSKFRKFPNELQIKIW